MTIPSEQAEVVRFLTDISGAPPRETHISAVFVSDDTAWKLKKSVRLPFLDFTTPEARQHFLLRELELNQPAAPAIYQDVIAIARQPDGALGFGGDRPVDWVLRMARVPADDFLDVLAAQHRMNGRLLDALGDCVLSYHTRLPSVPGWDSAASMRRIADGNAASARAAGLSSIRIEVWRAAIEAAIDQAADRLARRSGAGLVRRCHGDLHLGNLCLWDGQPVPFDALEFDENLATIDVAYDLAFLLMDLDLKAGRAAANRVLNRYVGRGGDTDAIACLSLFLSQRALIRAHVFAAMGDIASAGRHLCAADAYLQPTKGRIVAIGGLQGTGKSTISRALAPRLGAAPGALIVRSDEIRKRSFGVPPEQRLPADAYNQDANAQTNSTLITQAIEVAQAGHSVMADSTFLDPALRHDLEAIALQTKLPFTGIWLDAPLNVLEERIRSRQGDASDATVDVLHRSAKRSDGGGHWHKVDASDIDKATSRVAALLSQLSEDTAAS